MNTADGSRATIVNSDDANLGAIDPSGTYLYWSTANSERILGLWRRAVLGGRVEQVLAGEDVPGPYMSFSLSGDYVVLAGNRHDGTGGWDYGVFDGDFEPIGQLRGGPYGQVIGFLEDRLVVYPAGTNDLPPTVRLVALDVHDWSADELVSIDVESKAAIMPAQDGTSQLVFEGHDRENRYTLNALGADGSARVLFVGEAPWDEPATSIVYSPTSHVVEADGWVAVFPQGQALTAAALSGGNQGSRRMVRISDGEVAFVPALGVEP